MSAIAGRVLLIPKGNYDSTATYTMLDMVVYNGSSYICKQECTGVVPTNTTYWMLNASGSAVAYINDIGDVVITNPTNGQVLMYDSATQKWVNGTLSTTLAGLTDTQIASLQNGQVLKYNATTQKWENAEDTGGLLPHLIIIAETGESVVKAVKGTTEIIATETSTGHYECDVPEFGTWTIHAVLNGDDATVNLVVDTVKVYTVDDSHFHADITVTYPSGATCNLAGEGESYYATGSPYTFTVHHAGNYTITVTYNGQTYTDTVTVTTTGQTFTKKVPTPSSAPANDIDWWLWFGDVSGSYSSLADILADSTALATLMASTDAVDYLVRCKEWINKALVPTMTSDTTPSGEAFASANQGTSYVAYKAFDGDDTTRWSMTASNVLGAYIGYKFTTPTKVNRIYTFITGQTRLTNCEFKVQGSNDGTTWTDIDTITWLAQNGEQSFTIQNNTEYLYYRLYCNSANGMLSDSQGSTHYCMFYTLQFYPTAEGIPENQNAMSYIGLNNYCANTLLADSDWLEGIANSTYFESVLNVKVPTMTSATTPSGECFSSSNVDTSSVAYKAFDGDSSTRWYPRSNNTNNFIGYKFTESNKACVVKIKYSEYGTFSQRTFKIQGSNDGTNYTDIDEFVLPAHSGNTEEYYDFVKSINNSNNYMYYRLFTPDVLYLTSTYVLSLYEIQFYGREDV